MYSFYSKFYSTWKVSAPRVLRGFLSRLRYCRQGSMGEAEMLVGAFKPGMELEEQLNGTKIDL